MISLVLCFKENVKQKALGWTVPDIFNLMTTIMCPSDYCWIIDAFTIIYKLQNMIIDVSRSSCVDKVGYLFTLIVSIVDTNYVAHREGNRVQIEYFSEWVASSDSNPI